MGHFSPHREQPLMHHQHHHQPLNAHITYIWKYPNPMMFLKRQLDRWLGQWRQWAAQGQGETGASWLQLGTKHHRKTHTQTDKLGNSFFPSFLPLCGGYECEAASAVCLLQVSFLHRRRPWAYIRMDWPGCAGLGWVSWDPSSPLRTEGRMDGWPNAVSLSVGPFRIKTSGAAALPFYLSIYPFICCQRGVGKQSSPASGSANSSHHHHPHHPPLLLLLLLLLF